MMSVFANFPSFRKANLLMSMTYDCDYYNFVIILIIFLTRGKPLVAQKLQKKTTKLVWK